MAAAEVVLLEAAEVPVEVPSVRRRVRNSASSRARGGDE